MSIARERRPERAILIGRSVVAPVLLALTTVAAIAGAILALLPAALQGGPAGRLGARDVIEPPPPEVAEETVPRRAANDPVAP